MKASAKNTNISPKKMNIVAGMIRTMPVAEAVNTLQFTNKKAAKILLKVLNSAVANAKTNFKQDPAKLVIDEIKVSKGLTMKRFKPVSRGRAHGIKKVKSHVILTLKSEAKMTPAKASKKEAPAKTTEVKEAKKPAKKTTTTKKASK